MGSGSDVGAAFDETGLARISYCSYVCTSMYIHTYIYIYIYAMNGYQGTELVIVLSYVFCDRRNDLRKKTGKGVALKSSQGGARSFHAQL